MKVFGLFVVLLVVVGVCIVGSDYYACKRYDNLHKEHQQLIEGQKRLFEGIKATYEKGMDNGKKLDILLRIATNRVDGMTYTE